MIVYGVGQKQLYKDMHPGCAWLLKMAARADGFWLQYFDKYLNNTVNDFAFIHLVFFDDTNIICLSLIWPQGNS
jgi:hypothetical protein